MTLAQLLASLRGLLQATANTIGGSASALYRFLSRLLDAVLGMFVLIQDRANLGTWGDLNSAIPLNLRSLDYATRVFGNTHTVPTTIQWSDPNSTSPVFYGNWLGESGPNGLWYEYVFPVPPGKTSFDFTPLSRLSPDDPNPAYKTQMFVVDVGTPAVPLNVELARAGVTNTALDQPLVLAGPCTPGTTLLLRICFTQQLWKSVV